MLGTHIFSILIPFFFFFKNRNIEHNSNYKELTIFQEKFKALSIQLSIYSIEQPYELSANIIVCII